VPVPLEAKFKEVIASDLDWHDFVWSDFQLKVFKRREGLGEDSEIKPSLECVGTFEPLKSYKLYNIRFSN